MMVGTFLLGALMAILGLMLALKAVRGVSIIARLLRRPTSPVARLQDGPVEVVGKVTAIGEPLLSISGHRCVAVKTTVNGCSRSGPKDTDPTTTGTKTSQRVVPVRLVDATGACRLDLDLAELVGERWVSKPVTDAVLANASFVELVPPGSNEVTIEEHIIPEGATVLVSGDASQAPREPGYRDGNPTEWVISGTAEDLLVLSIGGQTRLIAKTVAIGSLAFGIGAYLAVLGTMMMVVSLFS